VEDFRRAFGRDPPPVAEAIALFTDNDQTREPVEAYYGAVMALPDCSLTEAGRRVAC
jgi:Protein of unknown function (DUF3047)